MILSVIEAPPDNLDEFVQDILPEYARLHGPVAARDYEFQGAAQLRAAIENPAIRAYAALSGNRALALFLVRISPSRYVLSFAHAFEEVDHADPGSSLADFILSDPYFSRNLLFTTECISYCTMELAPVFEGHGFAACTRMFMRKAGEPTPTAPCPPGYSVRPGRPDDRLDRAKALYSTYKSHPERALYEEVSSVPAATNFLQACEAGVYGHLEAGYALGAWHDNACVGIAIGTEVVAEMGFVIHMAVVPEHQQRGLGRHFLDVLVSNFDIDGLAFAALCVTCGNNAAHLYSKSGFETMRSFPVYFRDAAQPGT